MLRINNIKLPVDREITEETLFKKAAKALKTSESKIKTVKISKKSIDSRDKSAVFYVLSLDVELKSNNEEEKFLTLKNVSSVKPFYYEIPLKNSKKRPVVAGFGPGGMMCALVLAAAGLKPVVLERGKRVEERKKDIEKFFKTGILDTNSNVQFGEGGAGTFSDGKLTTGIKDRRCRYVLEQFAAFGAPKEILYLAKPHIGTDRLLDMVKNIRLEIERLGGEILFGHRLTDIEIKNNRVVGAAAENNGRELFFDTDSLVLAIGHSARDTFEMLCKKSVAVSQKPFSVGVRIEHSQEMISLAQYGRFAEYLPAADYKLAAHLKNGRSAYTFCMCPGGYVVAAASEKERLVTNGMSYFKRDGINANSALLIGVYPSDFPSDDPLSGVEFQRQLEHKAYVFGGGGYNAPFQLAGDLLEDKKSASVGRICPTYKPGVTPADMRDIFPDYIYESLKLGLEEMNKKIKGFACPDAVLTAVESRSSSPIRIERDEMLCSAVKGLLPCGEGCGYAGGIVSAAVDGIKCAEAIMETI